MPGINQDISTSASLFQTETTITIAPDEKVTETFEFLLKTVNMIPLGAEFCWYIFRTTRCWYKQQYSRNKDTDKLHQMTSTPGLFAHQSRSKVPSKATK